MPQDRFGNPYFYPTKVNGFVMEEQGDPKNDPYIEGIDSDFSTSGYVITMHPNGPTSFSVGRNGRSFTDSIGGCDMDFAATASRGYSYKSSDVRDLEFKCLIKFNIGGNGFSISCCTGHHSSSGCCQGFAYMFNLEPSTNPTDFRFRKEMWHVSYHDSPEGVWNHSKANFKIDGSGKYVGIGFCRYNKPVSGGTSPRDDHVILEGWFNPDPEANRTNWIMLKRIEDYHGNGWGDDGDHCNGYKDQPGVWSGAHNRLKTNATSGTVSFKDITFREIDPFGSFETTPPPTGGGAVTRRLYYAMVRADEALIGTAVENAISITMSHEIVESQTDPDPFGTFGATSWKNYGVNPRSEVSDECSPVQFADGLWVEGYWSNNDANCVAPHVNESDLGGSSKFTTNGGPVLKTPGIYLIYWGTVWRDAVSAPSPTGINNLIQNKLLGTDKEYFSKLSQYGQIGIPVWKGAVFNVTTPIPSNTIILEADGKKAIIDSFNTGLLPIPAAGDENIYILIIPDNKDLAHVIGGSTPLGFHNVFDASLTPPVTTTPPPTGCPPGSHLSNGVCVADTPPPSTITRVRGFFKLNTDINTVRGSGACTGTGGGGGGPGGDLVKIYDVDADADNERALSDTPEWKNRKRATEQIISSDSVLRGQVVKQFDVPLKKAGSPSSNHTVFARIWSSASTPTVIYTSPTTFDPSTFTTSFVTKTFDFSTNTHALQIGERIGIEFRTTSDVDFVRTSFGDNTTGRSEMVTYEGTRWVVASDRDLAATMWS